tara:strand:- start:472 stop:762 length:291 start_codon:yes stop_codon:yes gene_type:complete
VKIYVIGLKHVPINVQVKSSKVGLTVKQVVLVVERRPVRKEHPTPLVALLMQLARKLRIKSIKSVVQQGKVGRKKVNRTFFTDILDYGSLYHINRW